MSLQIYNTLTRSLEPFEPLDPDLVRIYNCGPTVYGDMHIGHAKPYVSFDIVVRWLRHLYGPDRVLYVMNITDVGHLVDDAEEGDDKIEAQARRENRSPYEIAAHYEANFWRDMDLLNCRRPDRTPHATDFVRQQIQMAATLIERGVAYESNGSVYFDVDAWSKVEKGEGIVEYGALSNRKVEDQTGGERIGENREKRNQQDFALWKRAEENHFMQWYSPWGWGFPGWHLECSVMSTFYLGDTFDIHGGGIENQFPHHECEIAQSQAATGKPFVRYWMHNNMVNVDGKKMGKSIGNTSNVFDLVETYSPMALRFFIAQSHYRSPLEFDRDAIAAAGAGYERLRGTMLRLREHLGDGRSGENRLGGTDGGSTGSAEADRFLARFSAAMNDDFNTPVAIGHLFEAVSRLNILLNDGATVDGATLDEQLRAYERLLRFGFEEILGLEFPSTGAADGVTPALMEMVIELRKKARERKDFETADAIRDGLQAAGVVLEDGKEGTRWRIEN